MSLVLYPYHRNGNPIQKNKNAAAGRMALNILGVAEPAKRVAERPAGKARSNLPQSALQPAG